VWGVLCASLVVVLTLGGCAGSAVPGAATPTATTATTPEATATPEATPTPTVTEPASRNNLTGDQIVAMATACGGLAAADPAAPGMPLRDLSQWAADALGFFTSTLQCGEIAGVVARDAARTDPEGTVFSSPLQLIDPPCPAGTAVSFWAHYDDDLIFANPALQQAFDNGQCLRTLFFTGSDAGAGSSPYAANREAGIRAAYDAVRGTSGPWHDRTVLLRNGLTLTVTQPEGDSRISILFLRLADGGVNGGGYQRTGWESLNELIVGDLPVLHTIDTDVEVTLEQLNSMVVEVASGYHATSVLASLPGFADGASGDHPDHRSVGRIVAAQVDAGLIDPNIVQYAMGYPTAQQRANIDRDPLARKLKVFAIYAAHDPVIACRDSAGCLKVSRFGDWLQRQYLIPHNEMVRVRD
jgi:LmbE family N-acetylglucosaminyl deacetylase